MFKLNIINKFKLKNNPNLIDSLDLSQLDHSAFLYAAKYGLKLNDNNYFYIKELNDVLDEALKNDYNKDYVYSVVSANDLPSLAKLSDKSVFYECLRHNPLLLNEISSTDINQLDDNIMS